MNTAKAALVGLVTITLLACMPIAVAAQSASPPSGIPGLVTDRVEPGVLRVLRDDAGHDLTERHPAHRRDMDRIAVGPDGTVWIASTAHGSDNDLLRGFQVWALGRPGIYGLDDGVPEDIASLSLGPDGGLVAVGSSVATFDGRQWSSDGETYHAVAPDGTLWLIRPEGGLEAWDGTTFTRYLRDVPMYAVGVTSTGKVWAVGEDGLTTFDGTAWTAAVASPTRAVAPDGTVWLVHPDTGVESIDGATGTRYLKGSHINQIAIAPDGAVWAVGSVGEGPGGLYVIRPEAGARKQATPRSWGAASRGGDETLRRHRVA